ncbi:potassium channel family protein [Halalkalicoccus tibetensis]|uniref:Potassium channel family protein n=1 Tax=Halalkalicoccus tibetensis TaxID=175632 RepID=A0ABD5V4D9_9EURY
MNGWWRRISLALTVVFAIVVTYASIYRWGMATFEGESVPFVQATQKVVESLTTAGFGGHAPWSSLEMNLIVLGMNLTGVLLVFLALPVFAIPMFRQAVQSTPPTSSDLTDHVIICSYTSQDEVLRAELDAIGVPYLLVDRDPDVVTDLVDDGAEAIHGDPERIDTLRAANAGEARALVADVDDETNPTVILSAKRANPDLRVVSVARDHEVAPYHEYAGADEVVQSRQQLGTSLAMRAMTSFSEKLRGTIGMESNVEVTELLVEEDSDLVGRTLEETDVFDRKGASVIGAWLGGKFVVAPGPTTTIEENIILLVTDRYDDFQELQARPIPTHRGHPSRVVVCGYGTVGWVVAEELRKEGVDVDVIDLEEGSGADIVGDVTDPETLSEADLENARTVVLALDEDVPTIYATLVLKQLAPDVEIVARADEAENVWKLYNAGADFVLSLPTVAGEILASDLIDETEILTARTEFEFTRTDAPALAGRSLGDVDVRAETGCTVVAVERDDELLTDLGAEFVVREDDELVVAGTEAAIERFEGLTHERSR